MSRSTHQPGDLPPPSRRRREGPSAWLRRMAGAVAFAYTAAGAWALVDTFLIVKPDGLRLHCAGIGIAVWALPTVAIVAVALVVRTLISRMPRIRSLLFPTEERLPRALTAIMWSVGGVFAIDRAFAILGDFSTITQRMGLAAAALAYLLIAGLLDRPVEGGLAWLLARLPRLFRQPGAFLTVLITVGVLGLILGRLLEPDYFRELGWELPASLATVFIAALLGTVAPRWTLFCAGGLAGLVLGITAWHHTNQPPTRATYAMRGRGQITPFFIKLMEKPRPAPNLVLPEVVQACRPGDTLTPVGEIGEVGEEAPDIVLLTIDGWRWDHSSMADGGKQVTPLIASRARHAAVFERAYAPAPSTRHSFRTLFSGIMVGRVAGPRTARNRWALSMVEGQPTLASYLDGAGYETIAWLSDPHAFPPAENGLAGFSEIDDHFRDFASPRGYVASYTISHIIARLARPPEPGESPRFLWTHLGEPHYPYSFGPELPTPTSGRLPNHQRHLHSLRYVDQQVDRLLEFLSGIERKDKTWVIITSDHGEQFNEHGHRRHGNTVYEEEVHVPLLIWGPGVDPGPRETPVGLIDLFPTMVEAAGLEVPNGICGESLLESLLSGGEPEARPVYVAAVPDRTVEIFKYAWIDGDDKLIVDGSTGTREVYDLSVDPDEHDNLAEDDPEVGQGLVDDLHRYFVDHGIDPAEYRLDED
ncbi:MAG: sulfatase [Deltaproteobacteria bacterium]|nr:sulfatase [Deltaproteobacteria bacterium]